MGLSSKGGLLYIRNDRSRAALELQLETISIMRLTCEEFCATSEYGSTILYLIVVGFILLSSH